MSNPTPPEPIFYNLQTVSVDVYDENKKRVEVMPNFRYGRDPGATYRVKGEWYRQFVAPYGPLTLFRPTDEDPGFPAAAAPPLPQTPSPRTATVRPVAPAPTSVAGVQAQAHVPPSPAVPESAEVDIDVDTRRAVATAAPDASAEEQESLARFIVDTRAGLNPEYPTGLPQYAAAAASIIDPNPVETDEEAMEAAATRPMPKPIPKKAAVRR